MKLGGLLVSCHLLSFRLGSRALRETTSFGKEYTEQLTEDHSWVAQQVKNGSMTKEMAANHSSRHILTECLCVNAQIHPFFRSGSLHPGETILVCSDGFYTMVNAEAWQSYIDESNNSHQNL